MRLGLWGARADNSGLGIQTWEFYKHMKPVKTMLADISQDNHKENDFTWYAEGTPLFQLWPDEELIRDFLKDLDVVFVAETPYNWDFFKIAKEMGVKTIMQYNYEFLEYYNHPEYPLPDVMIAPSPWHFDEVEKKFVGKCQVKYIPVPVNRELIVRRKIKKARVFIHIAGYELYKDRNGTDTLLEAIQHIRSKIKLIIYTQHKLKDFKCPGNVTLILKEKTIHNYWELYKIGDVMVMPRRYGGLCLPLNESMAAGMIPMMPNVEPQNRFLHNQTLTPVCKRTLIPAKSPNIYAYDVEPFTLAYHIDLLASANHGMIEGLSDYSDSYAHLIDWKTLKPLYDELFGVK